MADRYRMKPLITVEAMQVGGDDRDADTDERGVPDEMLAVAEWVDSQVTVGHDRRYEVEVPGGRQGPSYARPGDWVVKLDDDTFEIVDAATFDRLYVPAGTGNDG